MKHVGFRWVSDGACRFQMGLQWGIPVSDGSPMKHVEVSDQACQSPLVNVSYRWGMSVFDGSPVRHASDLACQGLQWFSDQTCRSPMKHVKVFDGSLIRHVGLRCSMSRSLMGLQSGMLVSDEACRGLQWVSDQECRSQM